MNTLEDRIRQLRLPGILASLESRNAYALENKISYLDFLELLLEDEWARRQYQQQHRKLQQSKLHQQKRLDNYDYSFQPELDKKLLMDLASCRYVHQQQNIIFMGKPGVGKTHLANALGLEAVHQGLNVILTHAHSLIEDLHRAKADGKYHTLLNRIKKLDLLIIADAARMSWASRKYLSMGWTTSLRSSGSDMKKDPLSLPLTEVLKIGDHSLEIPSWPLPSLTGSSIMLLWKIPLK